jgi:hypothetical protein
MNSQSSSFPGPNAAGTIFSLSPPFTFGQTFTLLYSFCSETNCIDGTTPKAGLIQGADLNLYGTASAGGNNINGDGTVFQCTPPQCGSLNVWPFDGITQGSSPASALIQGTDGNFYGTASTGGKGSGTIFQFNPAEGVVVEYSFNNKPDGAGPVGLIQGSGLTFYATRSHPRSADQTANFTANPVVVDYTISGQVTLSGNSLNGVTMTLSGSQSGSTGTNGSGSYSFSEQAGGNYTVTPSLGGYTFSPPSASFNGLSGNQTANFTANPVVVDYTISGQVTLSGNGLNGVTMTLSGSQSGSTGTNGSGSYSFSEQAGGNYTVTPSLGGYTFSPPSASFNGLSGNQTANFTATLVTTSYTISGQVTLSGNGLSGVAITLSGSQSGSTGTNGSGGYSFTEPAGGNYTVTPSLSGYTFSPPSQTFNGLSGNQAANFSASAVVGASAVRFISIPPCRVVDTRDDTKPFGFGPPFISGETSRSFPIPNGSCNIPAASEAYSLNVTVVPHGELGYITVWPTGQNRPVASTLNSLDGEVKANAAIVPAGTGGAIGVFATDDTDVILDINGYFVPLTNSSGLAFYPMTPCRLVDTRPGAPSTVSTGALTGYTSRTLPLLASSCNVPATAQAYSLNFTLIPPAGQAVGYLTVYPTGGSLPTVSTLNDPTGTVEANAAIAPAGTGGSIDVLATDPTDLAVDINGYFAPAAEGALSLYTLPTCRALDTRNPAGAPPFAGTINVNVLGSGCGGTDTAQAYVFNATVVPDGFLGYLTLWPEGNVKPVVSTLNAYNGDVTSNMAIVPTSNTEISAFATSNTFLILDISGYFAP